MYGNRYIVMVGDGDGIETLLPARNELARVLLPLVLRLGTLLSSCSPGAVDLKVTPVKAAPLSMFESVRARTPLSERLINSGAGCRGGVRARQHGYTGVVTSVSTA